MPDYNWSCLSCGTGNDKENVECSECGCPANAKRFDVKSREYLIKHAGCKCNVCSDIYKITFSEDAASYERRGAIFRILYLNTLCKKCNSETKHEYMVPSPRKWYRNYFGETGDRWFFKI